jgi:ABC-type phosphate/phosphonate transport system substrate-binding protein
MPPRRTLRVMFVKPLTIGAVAYDAKVVPIWEGIRDFFRAHHTPLDYVLYGSYEQQVEALLARHVDIAWNTNVAWLRVQKRCEGRARAIAMRDTDLEYLTVMVTRAGVDARAPGDLRGKRVALGSADSGQAAILPVHWLAQAGLAEGKDYAALRFDRDVGKHGDTGTSELDVIAALVDGRADAGFVGDATWARLFSTGGVDTSKVRSAWTSPGYHHCNFTVLPDFPTDREVAFTRTLFQMDYADPAVRPLMDLEGLKQWVPGSTAGYASLEAAMQAQGLL